MRRPLSLLAAAAVVVAVGGGATAIATSSSSSSSSSSATVKTRHTPLGTILVDAKGRTLYLFEKDTTNKSRCSGECATDWPPALTSSSKPKGAGGAATARLGTTRRGDGTRQITYAGHPLYRFEGDANKPGQTTGEGINAFGARWYVLSTSGRKVVKGGGGSGYGS